jgi:SOS-response transcriptional repressor LexA
MSAKLPSQREHELLVIIYRYISEHEEAPYPRWLQEESGFGVNYVSNLIRRLVKKGYLERQLGRPVLTDKALQYFSDLDQSVKTVRPFSIVPTQIRVRGQVRAGDIGQDELRVDLSESSGPGDEFILVPQARLERETYALEVVGDSMEHEGVFEGDYIIVEEFGPFEGPRDGEMIVTKYLPIYAEPDGLEADISDFDLHGPTVKIYSEVVEDNERRYRLSWKRDNRANPYIIRTRYVRPIGRVIGVYRSLK